MGFRSLRCENLFVFNRDVENPGEKMTIERLAAILDKINPENLLNKENLQFYNPHAKSWKREMRELISYRILDRISSEKI